MQSQVVSLMAEVEHWKKQATTLEGEKQGNTGNADKLSKEVEGLKDEVSPKSLTSCHLATRA